MTKQVHAATEPVIMRTVAIFSLKTIVLFLYKRDEMLHNTIYSTFLYHWRLSFPDIVMQGMKFDISIINFLQTNDKNLL